jgi:uncharacterized membrane protein
MIISMLKYLFIKIDQQGKLPSLLAFSLLTFSSLVFIGVRVLFAPNKAYVFLIWNLFLAWLPYLIGIGILIFEDRLKPRLWFLLILFFWILFFPNAPYIATDFFHFEKKPGVPVWFDLVMLFLFGLTGLLLGLMSLMDVQAIINRRRGCVASWIFALFVLFFGGFGVYVGRYLRWNSWDIFIDPDGMFKDILFRFTSPFHELRAVGVTLIFSFFLMTVYVALKLLVSNGHVKQAAEHQ